MVRGATPRSRCWLLGLVSLAAGCQRDTPAEGASPLGDAVVAGSQRVAIEAGAQGFVPTEVHVTQGKPAVLEFTRTVESSCVNAVKMPWREEPYDLPLNRPVNVVIPDTSKAGTFSYACWMNMVHGKVVIDAASGP